MKDHKQYSPKGNYHKFLLIVGTIFIFLTIILNTKPVSASFNVSVTPIQNHIDVGGVAKYIVSIQNTGSTTSKYELDYFLPFWTVYIPDSSILNGNVKIAPGDRYNFNVNLIPSSSLKTNTNRRPSMKIIELNTKISKPVYFLVYYALKSEKFHYSPLIDMTAQIEPKEINPKSKFKVSVTLMNQNPLNYTNLTLVFLSKIIKNHNKTYRLIDHTENNIHLLPRAIKTYSFIFKLQNPKEKPKNDSFSVFLQYNNQLLTKVTDIPFRIVGYKNTVSYPTQKNGSFPVYSWTYSFYNNGTLSDTVKVKFPITWYNSRLTSYNLNPTYTYSLNGQKYLVWVLDIYPNQRISLIIHRNYWAPIIIIAIIIGLIIFYYVFRTPVLVKKKISSINTTDGGISDIKILINLKSRVNRKIRRISIIEYIPSIAGINMNFEVGSLKPSKILTNSKKGTILKWDLDELNPLEERIISYKFKPRLTLIGDFTLPAAIVKFDSRGGTRTVRSNSLYVKA